MKRLIVYDLDGTLVDTQEDIAAAVNHMLEALGSSPLPSDDIRRFVGQGLHDLITRSLKTNDPDHVQEGLKLFEAHYATHLTDHSVLYPHATTLLDYFKSRKQAVITNKPHAFARDLLAALGVADYFVELLAGGCGYPKKPDPTAFLALMKRHHVWPQDTLLVGDSLIDVNTGRNAGVFTVIMTHGFEDQEALAAASPDATVRNFQDLLRFVQQHGW